jgi:hypothetical protein
MSVSYNLQVKQKDVRVNRSNGRDVTGPEITSIRCQGTIYVCSADNGLKLADFLLFVLLTQIFLQGKMFWPDNNLNATVATEKV